MRVHENSEQDFSEIHLYLSSKKLLISPICEKFFLTSSSVIFNNMCDG